MESSGLGGAPRRKGQSTKDLTPFRDMIWTQANGTVDIEIIEEGGTPIIFESITLKGPDGHVTGKNQLPGNTYFIMQPASFVKAKVNRMNGEVWVATNPTMVIQFYEKYHTMMSISCPMDRSAHSRWHEGLRNEESD